jgi:hypothetical protein
VYVVLHPDTFEQQLCLCNKAAPTSTLDELLCSPLQLILIGIATLIIHNFDDHVPQVHLAANQQGNEAEEPRRGREGGWVLDPPYIDQ